MIQRYPFIKIPLLLTFSLFLFHLAQKDFDNPYERPIAGDAQAYYAYLPAIFIYSDLSYDFLKETNQKYYPTEIQKDFLKEAGEGVVNKTFPGVAVLYLPFFLIAHILSLLFGLPADGYSFLYQLLFDIGLWTYLFLGLVVLNKILFFLNFNNRVRNYTLLALVLGTNIFFYSVYDQSVTHIYNFFMVNMCVYTLFKFKEDGQFKWVGILMFFLALMAITRPTNGLALGLFVFFFPSWKFFRSIFQSAFKPLNFLKIVLIIVPIMALPFLLWKAQVNSWIVYSYGEEVFVFSQPHLPEFLFSYFKGWFTYTPLALVMLILGFYFLYHKNKTQVWIGIMFYAICVYIFSCWWCWYYGAGMSQRVMIDHYILLAFLMALTFQKIAAHNWLKYSVTIITILTIGLNIVQAYQIRHGIISGGSATKEKYWDTFLDLDKKARVYPFDHWKLEQTISIDLNPESKNTDKSAPRFIEDAWTTEVNEFQPYSSSVLLKNLNLRRGARMRLSFEARARHDIKETRMVFVNNKELIVFGLDQYLKKDEWVRVEWLYEPLDSINHVPSVYFWNGNSHEKVEFKSFKIDLFFAEKFL